MATEAPDDYAFIARELAAGAMVPFLGAGASVECGFPTALAVAERLAEGGRYPDPEGLSDLARVASYLNIVEGTPWLKRKLGEIFKPKPEPGVLQTYLASLDKLRLVVTTNYDDLLELAFRRSWLAGGEKRSRQPWTVVDRGSREKIWLGSVDGKWKPIRPGDLQRNIDPDQPIIFKMHGSINRQNEDDDEYLVTEEHYIDFLGRGSDFAIPPAIAGLMQARHLLFLGYALHDWNVRVLLAKLNRRPGLSDSVRSIAVMRKVDEKRQNARLAEQTLCKKQNITILEATIAELLEQVGTAKRPATAP